MKFSNWLSQRALQKKDAIAIIFKSPSEQEGERWTYAELESEVNDWVERLQALGIRSGDRIGLLLSNHPRYMMIVHALVKCEAIAVFLNIRLTAEELRWQIEDSQAQYLLYDELSKLTANILDKKIGRLITFEISNLSLQNYQAHSNQPNSESIDLENIQGIFYTSGTTGKPKAVPLTYSNHFHSAIASALNLGVEPNDNWLLCMPLFHVGGLAIAWRSVINGTKITLLPKFDQQEVLNAIASEQVTLISLVPTMLSRLLNHPQWQNLQKLRAILLGGAPASPELIAQCLQLNLPIMPTYGMTETASQITTLLPHQVPIKQGSSGLPLFGNQLRIVDDHLQDLEVGAIGQILVQGASVMHGYLHQFENAPIQAGWLHTGDLGYCDREGYLYVVSRRSDLIISGGENIYPTEIEAILLMHPHINEVCIVAVSDREWGQIVAAVIVTKTQLSLQEIRDFCEQNALARFKLPKSIYIWESLPKTASGKLLRQEICDRIELISHIPLVMEGGKEDLQN